MNRKLSTRFSRNAIRMMSAGIIASAAWWVSEPAQAQLSSNPDKFLGNITTSYNVDFGNEKYYTLWNQITCENESKWASIEGTNNSFNWGGSDNAYNYAKSHNFPFKFHALVWGAQYPNWLEKQTPEQRYKEIVQWMDAVKKRYPDLQLIDVVNEAIAGHQAGTKYFIEALGGTGKTGYDWIIKAFELAYERWPNAILIYNDFNTFQWNTDQYIDIVKTLRDAGAPIDAYGCQSHDLTNCDLTTFKNSMTKLQNSLKIPMYSTEYDIGTTNDALQLQRYKEQIPYMWEQDYVAGVTLWGYIHGRTWTNDGKDENGNDINPGHSGIIKDGKDRPAMTWLREYMKSDKAKNAKSPFPGMKKEASVYVKPEALNVEKGKETTITVRAAMRTKTIEKVDLYVKGTLAATMTEAPYEHKYTPTTPGAHALKAIVTCTDGTTYERLSNMTACNARAPYKNTIQALPGTIEAENFDSGGDGIAFHDNNSSKQGDAASYRTDAGGIDVVKGGTGYAVGYGEVGEWMEYTVNVKEAGLYSYTIRYSAPEDGASFNLSRSDNGNLTSLTPASVTLPKSSNWSTYKTVYGRLTVPLEEGEQVIRLTLTGGSGTYVMNIDKIAFTHIDVNDAIKLTLASDPKVGEAGSKSTITANVTADADIKNVRFYVDGVLSKTVSAAPYEYAYTPAAQGTYAITAFATDTDGKVSKAATLNMKVNPKRTPYKGVISIPGTIEAENFDKCGEGFSFHDSDTKDEGNAGYRTDNGGIDIKKLSIGGYGLGWTSGGEWMEYSVNVTEAGQYTCEAVVSSGTTGSSFRVSRVVNGTAYTLWSINVPKTGDNSWDTYKTVTSPLKKTLEEGQYIIRIQITGANCDIDNITLKCVVPTAIEEVETEQHPQSTRIYNLAGQVVGEDYKGIVIKNGKKYLQR